MQDLFFKQDLKGIGLVDPVSIEKVINETSNGSFKPLAVCTKEQAIVIALRLYHCVM